jgi:hypothetical protein
MSEFNIKAAKQNPRPVYQGFRPDEKYAPWKLIDGS